MSLGNTIKYLGIVAVFSVTGCVTSHVIVGKVRPPISPDQVQLYLHPPAREVRRDCAARKFEQTFFLVYRAR
jgi:hypothetical protein